MRWLLRIIAGLGIAGGLAFAALVAFGWYMYSTYGEKDWSRIGDATGVKRITLRAQSSAQVIGGPTFLRDWVLDVPRAFMGTETGSNRSGTYIVTTRMALNPVTMELIPNPQSFIGRDGWIDFFIDFRNGPAPAITQGYSEVLKSDFCFDSQEVREKIYQQPPERPVPGMETVRGCNSANCRFQLRVDGWPVEVVVPRSSYHEKEKHCRFSRELLHKWTVSRQSLRQ